MYGVLPYIAPKDLNGEPYTFASDIYSFGVILAECSFYKKLAYRSTSFHYEISLQVKP
ncbi:438_t:CDS:2 [Funneliformis geosporum]|nr:438_t:CDS:2 [Funneliformis geosporum]